MVEARAIRHRYDTGSSVDDETPGSIGSRDKRIGDGAPNVLIGGVRRADGGAIGRILGNGGRGKREGVRGFVDVRDGHRQRLLINPALAVGGFDNHLVDVVASDVGGNFEIRWRIENDSARQRVDTEATGIGPARNPVGDAVASVLISGRNRRHGPGVLGHDQAGRGCAGVRRDDRRVVRIQDRNCDLLVKEQAALVGHPNDNEMRLCRFVVDQISSGDRDVTALAIDPEATAGISAWCE